MWIQTQSDIISKVLSPALRLWLRSQVEQVEELNFTIQGRDRQILRGYIPSVSLSSSRAIYQGLHLGDLQLKGENIRINIGQVLKGKPLRLLEPIQVSGQLHLAADDLQASLSSSILANALSELLLALLELNGIANPTQLLESYQIQWQDLTLNRDRFSLVGMLAEEGSRTIPVAIRSGLDLLDPQTLLLCPIEIEGLSSLCAVNTTQFKVNLGSEVELETLRLEPERIVCYGRATVRP
jgi:hypothetical protein